MAQLHSVKHVTNNGPKNGIFNCEYFWGSVCIVVKNLVLITQAVAEIWRPLIFQNGVRPPSWICHMHVLTTHVEYLLVFITVQNGVGIDALVSMCKF